MSNTELFFTIYNFGQQYPKLQFLMIFGAEYLIFVSFLFMLVLLFKGSLVDKKAAFITLIALGVAVILTKSIRLFYFEPRPFITYPIETLVELGRTASFPSTHTTTMAVLAFSYLFYRSKFAIFFIIAAILVGISRIFVGVHYPLDIIGGILVGLISVLISLQLKKIVRSKITQT